MKRFERNKITTKINKIKVGKEFREFFVVLIACEEIEIDFVEVVELAVVAGCSPRDLSTLEPSTRKTPKLKNLFSPSTRNLFYKLSFTSVERNLNDDGSRGGWVFDAQADSTDKTQTLTSEVS